jgi:hypothetical protein
MDINILIYVKYITYYILAQIRRDEKFVENFTRAFSGHRTTLGIKPQMG